MAPILFHQRSFSFGSVAASALLSLITCLPSLANAETPVSTSASDLGSTITLSCTGIGTQRGETTNSAAVLPVPEEPPLGSDNPATPATPATSTQLTCIGGEATPRLPVDLPRIQPNQNRFCSPVDRLTLACLPVE